jgi:hypothetical protein
MNGGTILAGGGAGGLDFAWQIVGTGDHNGDGTSDLLWRHSTGTVVIWYMSAGGATGGGTVATVDPAWRIVVTH